MALQTNDIEGRVSSLGRESERHRSPSSASSGRRIKVLAISFAYPPMLEPRAIQVSRLLRHLDASTVVVCADYKGPGAPEELLTVDNADAHFEKVVRIPFSFSKRRRLLSAAAHKIKVPLWDKYPDHLRRWKKPVLKAIDELICRDHYEPELLVTFAYPLTDCLIGLELKRRYDLPWIAHFSDPWTDSPISHLDRLSKVVHLRLERRVVEAADRLVFTSDETVDLVMGKYGASARAKTRVLPHSFEPALYSNRSNGARSKITIRYLGTLYGQRTPKPLFLALQHLLASKAELLRDVCFEIVGDTCGLDINQLGLQELPPDLVKITPPVDYSTSVELMVSADGLLVIDAPAEESIFLPSKLIDYIGAGRPILGITPPGAAASLINRLGGWVANPSDDTAITDALTSFLSCLRDEQTNAAIWGRPEVRQSYEAEAVARQFGRLCEELI